MAAKNAAMRAERAEGGDRTGSASQGTPDPLELLFAKYHRKIYALAHSLLKSDREAMEVAREVFLGVARQDDAPQGTDPVSARMYRACVDACFRRLRRRASSDTVAIEPFLPAFTPLGTHAGAVEDWTANVKTFNADLSAAIRKFTGELPAEYRVALLLTDCEGLSHEQTARVLRLSVPVVKSRVHFARLYLRERLSRHLGGGPDA